MGQDISKLITPLPLSLTDCVVDSEIDICRYKYYRRRLNDMNQNNILTNLELNRKQKMNGSIKTKSKRARKIWSIKRHKLFFRDKDGSLR